MLYFKVVDYRASWIVGALESLLVCDEESLLSGARRFEESALAQIHDCFYEALYRYVCYRSGDGQVAEDATSEVFVRLLDALQNGKGPRKSLRGWLFGTASHIVDDHFRRRYRLRGENLENHGALAAGIESDPEHQFQLNLTHKQLLAVMSKLTPEQQHVIALRFGQGLPHREIAEMLHKSEGAVKLLQLRALRAMRRLLEPTIGQAAGDN